MQKIPEKKIKTKFLNKNDIKNSRNKLKIQQKKRKKEKITINKIK